MCETATINHSLVRLSKRSFAKRLTMVHVPTSATQDAQHVVINEKERQALNRMNSSIDKLYDLLYEAYPTVHEEDYKQFGPYLQILIQTLEDLLATYRHSALANQLEQGLGHLAGDISALKELDSDIRNFRINITRNTRFHHLMAQLKAV